MILEPLADDWQWLKDISLSRDSVALDEMRAAVNEDIHEQERPELDEFFK
ncbi:hypothetical protein FACS1894216_08650 [Synergistales bacterium]|nr:hypothetical protein FACS1894216_08650 [Synergistales bacterium]